MTTMKQIDVNAGWEACDAQGQKIGAIQEQRDNCFVVSKGTFFPKDIYVPINAVQRVDAGERRVYVNVTKDEIDSLGWDDPDNLPMSQSGSTTGQTSGYGSRTKDAGSWDSTTGTGVGSDTRDTETVGTMRTQRTGYGDQGVNDTYSDERLSGTGTDVLDDRSQDDFRTR